MNRSGGVGAVGGMGGAGGPGGSCAHDKSGNRGIGATYLG